MNPRFFIAVTTISLTTSLHLFSATSSETSSTNNADVIVTASPVRAFEKVSPDGADTVTVGRQQLERLNAADLPTALRQIPGVTVSRYSPIGAYGGGQGGSIYIRGSGTSRPGSEIKIYTEGAPRESGVWSHPLMDIAPITFAEEVTVARNPQPQRYPDTFGAVDMKLRRRTTSGHEAEGRIIYSRHKTVLGDIAAGGKEGSFDYYLGIAGGHSSGTREHNHADLWNLYLRAGWELSPEDTVAYIYQRTDNKVEDPGPIGSPTPIRDRFDTITDTHILRYDHQSDLTSGYALFYYEDGSIRWRKDHLSDAVITSPPGWSNTDWHNYGLRSAFDIQIEHLTLSAGLDWWSEGGNTRNIRELDRNHVFGYRGRFSTFAPLAGLRYEQPLRGNWTLTPAAGLRFYHTTSAFDDAWAPYAALTAKREELQLYLSYARGIHYPGIYAQGTSPNTWRQLDAEKLDTTSLGFRYDVGEAATLSASIYHSSINNRMESTAAGLINSGDTSVNGCEIAAHIYATSDLTLFAGAAYANPRQRAVSRLPEITFSAGASWRITRYLHWDTDCQYVASQYAHSMRSPNPMLVKVDDFFILNTRLSLDLQALSRLHGELTLAIENVLDKNYSYFPGYPMPGAMAYAGVKVKFW